MRQSIAILAVFAGAIAADTIDYYFPDHDGVDPVATIKTVNPSTTEFSLACPTGTNIDDCGFGPGIQYTILSKTRYIGQMNVEGIAAVSYGCDYNSAKTEMTCTVSASGANAPFTGISSDVLSGTDVTFGKASIVEGASLLSGAASADPKTTSAASSGSAVKTSGSSRITPSGTLASQTQSASGSAATAQHTGAAARFGIEGSALLALVGAGAMVL